MYFCGEYTSFGVLTKTVSWGSSLTCHAQKRRLPAQRQCLPCAAGGVLAPRSGSPSDSSGVGCFPGSGFPQENWSDVTSGLTFFLNPVLWLYYLYVAFLSLPRILHSILFISGFVCCFFTLECKVCYSKYFHMLQIWKDILLNKECM